MIIRMKSATPLLFICLVWLIQRFCEGFVTPCDRYRFEEHIRSQSEIHPTIDGRRWSPSHTSDEYFLWELKNKTQVVSQAMTSVAFAAGCLLVISIPIVQSVEIDPRYFLAGGICAAVSHGLMVPVDVIKTRIQASPLDYKDGFWHATKTILENEGGAVLQRGLSPTVVGYGIEGATKFGLYESLKPIVSECIPTDSTIAPLLLGSLLAGGTASLILCPLERIRIRLVTDDDYREKNLPVLSGLLTIIENEGLLSLFKGGFSAMLSKQLPYTVGKQVSFDLFAASLYSSLAFKDCDVVIVAAFGASIIACLLSQPGDVLLTQSYQDRSRTDTIPSLSEIARSIWVQQGLYGFLSGLSARFLHVGFIVQIQLVLYDMVKQSLGLPATGSA
jgi:solute carrier family 25 phosphate transporter 3